MRIISGKHRGRKLNTFLGDDIRPTSDKARESLFNMLAFKIAGAEFLDLCCGTGAVGIEAISRGASAVTFVDNSKESLKICEKNLSVIKESASVVCSDAYSFLLSTTKTFDFIFFDPPYAYNEIDKILKAVIDKNLLKDGGQFIYEHKVDKPSLEVEGFTLTKTKKYGIAIFDFYEIAK